MTTNIASATVPPANNSKFILRDFMGRASRHFLVDYVELPKPRVTPDVTDYVIVLDASGSMCYEIQNAKNVIKKVLALDEYNHENMRVTLISYASKGDVRVHFERVPVADIMATNSKFTAEIDRIHTRGMTCVSQAFNLALDIALKAEGTVGIVLHSDGYFNDPSPMQEQYALDAATKRAALRPNLFVNTIAHGWADYNALARISNALSGKCVAAKSIKEVYDALHDTRALLSGRVLSEIAVEADGASYVTSVNVSQRKINGNTTKITIRGVNDTNVMRVYRYREVSADRYQNANLPLAQHGVIYAYARAKLAEGALNEAKFGLASTGNLTLFRRHLRALTLDQLQAFALDLEQAMFGDEMYEYGVVGKGGGRAHNLIELFDVLNDNTDAFNIDLDLLTSNYKRMGVKKVRGVWSHEGEATPTAEAIKNTKFIPFDYSLEAIDDPCAVSTGGFSINNDEATVNLRVERPAKLVKTGSNATVATVAGIKLDKLKTYNNYTIISGGDLNVEALPLRIVKRALFNELRDMGYISMDSKFDPNNIYRIELGDKPLVDYNSTFDVPAFIVRDLAYRRMVISFCDAVLKLDTKSDDDTIAGWTPEQEQALRAVGLTPNLYFSPPTRNPYISKEDAVEKGLIDFRKRYKIEIGTADYTLTDLPAANKFFTRRFVGPAIDPKDPKSKLRAVSIEDVYNGTKITVKDTKRMKLTAVDDLMFPFFSALLGLNKQDHSDTIDMLEDYGVGHDDAVELLDTRDIKVAKTAAKRVRGLFVRSQKYSYSTYIHPLVFYVGASGLIPDGADFTMYDPKSFAEKFKVEASDLAMYYAVDRTFVLTVTAESVDVLTPAGLAEVKRLNLPEGGEE